MKVRVTVSLPEEQVAAMKRAVEAGAFPSVSSLVSEAIAAQVAETDDGDLIAELLERSGGPMSAEEWNWAAGVLTGRIDASGLA